MSVQGGKRKQRDVAVLPSEPSAPLSGLGPAYTLIGALRSALPWKKLSQKERRKIESCLRGLEEEMAFVSGYLRALGRRAILAGAVVRATARQKREAGRHSGAKRGRAQVYLAQAARLRQQGTAKHNIAGIIARRFGVSASAVRKAMRRAKQKSGTKRR